MKHLAACRHGPDPEPVHDLRVSIRRLRAHFRAARLLAPGLESRQAVVALRRLMRRLSRFRDLQVEQAMMGDLVAGLPCPAAYLERLKAEESAAAMILSAELSSFPEDRLASCVAGACRGLVEAGAGGPARRRLEDRLSREHQRLLGLRSSVDPADPGTIHRLRVAFKKYRYFVEPLASLSGDRGPGVLDRMHDLQGAMGDIQDLAVLARDLRSWSAREGKRKEAEPVVRHLSASLEEKAASLMPMLSEIESFTFPLARV